MQVAQSELYVSIENQPRRKLKRFVKDVIELFIKKGYDLETNLIKDLFNLLKSPKLIG